MPNGPVDIALTLESGQVFHWGQNTGGSWSGLIGREFFHIAQDGPSLAVLHGDPATAAQHFSLDHPLAEIEAAFPPEPLCQSALAACRGLRILRQPLWECTATFITSSMKQVAHIRGMSLAIRSKFGEPVEGSPVNAYPSFASLSRATERGLRDCGLGYRAANLLATARLLDSGKTDLGALAAQSTPDLRNSLQQLPGIGVKVANCILLFAYGRLDAVPIDTWIHRILVAMRRGRGGTPAQLAAYARRRLGPYGGYVQQYLFHHARTSRQKSRP